MFLNRYKMLSLNTWPTWNHSSIVEGVKYLLRDLPIPKGEFAFGRTKIFVRSPRTVISIILLLTSTLRSNYYGHGSFFLY